MIADCVMDGHPSLLLPHHQWARENNDDSSLFIAVARLDDACACRHVLRSPSLLLVLCVCVSWVPVALLFPIFDLSRSEGSAAVA